MNLDGAFGTSSGNAALITDLIKKTGVEIELGGGIRSVEDARQLAGDRRGPGDYLDARHALPACIRTLAKEFGSNRVMPVGCQRGPDCSPRLAGDCL